MVFKMCRIKAERTKRRKSDLGSATGQRRDAVEHDA